MEQGNLKELTYLPAGAKRRECDEDEDEEEKPGRSKEKKEEETQRVRGPSGATLLA